MTKIILTEADVQRCTDQEDSFREKFKNVKKRFEECQKEKECELASLHNELKQIKEDISDITQIKLDEVLKNQKVFSEQMAIAHSSSSTHGRMCREFLEGNLTESAEVFVKRRHRKIFAIFNFLFFC